MAFVKHNKIASSTHVRGITNETEELIQTMI